MLQSVRSTLSAISLLGLVIACGGPELVISDGLGNPTGVTTASADPALVTDPENGDLLMAWLGGEAGSWQLYFARSADSGRTWSEPVQVTQDSAAVAPHGEASPRLVATGSDHLLIVWPRDVNVPGRPWPASIIQAVRSTDGGGHWTEPVTLNDDTTGSAGGHTFHGATWAGDSGIVVAWLDERSGGRGVSAGHHHTEGNTPPENAGDSTSEADAAIYMVRSTDHGRTWSSNIRLWNAVCPCCRVTLDRRADGSVTSAWRRHFPGNVRDVVVADVPLTNDTLPAPGRVYQDDWVYPGCPHAGPGMAVDDSGRTHVVWYTGREEDPGVYYTRVSAGTNSFEPISLLAGAGVPTTHASIVTTPAGGALLAWDRISGGDRGIGVAWVDSGGQLRDRSVIPRSEEGAYPQVVMVGSSGAVTAWTSTVGDASRVRLARIAMPV
ncbi:MAG: sialidase family protein, partial [Gemmatimonadales bacterium]